MCKACYQDCQFELYRQSLANAISYFLKGVYEKNTIYIQALESPNNSTLFNPILSLEYYFDHNGFDVIQTGAFCKHTKEKLNQLI